MLSPRCLASLGLLLLASQTRSQPAVGARLEEVRFTSAGVELAATLHIPPGDGPFPAAVLVHGSGESDRSNPWTTAYANALVSRGVVVLHPDKRGSGASGGEWLTAGLLDLADDAAAALDLLRRHPGVDTSRVGLIGFSQGGHVAPAAAARSGRASFVVDVSGSTVPILDQIGDELALMGERAGLTAAEQAELAAIHAAGVRFVLTGEGWDDYFDALTAARSGRMGGMDVLQGLPDSPDSPAWAYARILGAFDPMDYWVDLDGPLLFIFGGRDTQVRVARSVARIDEVLGPLGRDYTLMVFRNNGHALFREDAMDFIARWIRDGGI